MVWFERAAAAGDSDSQVNLGNLHNAGEGVKRDFKKAVQYYRAAVAQEDEHALYNLATCFCIRRRHTQGRASGVPAVSEGR